MKMPWHIHLCGTVDIGTNLALQEQVHPQHWAMVKSQFTFHFIDTLYGRLVKPVAAKNVIIFIKSNQTKHGFGAGLRVCLGNTFLSFLLLQRHLGAKFPRRGSFPQNILFKSKAMIMQSQGGISHKSHLLDIDLKSGLWNIALSKLFQESWETSVVTSGFKKKKMILNESVRKRRRI